MKMSYNKTEISDLRRRSEELLKKKPGKTASDCTESESQKLIHELDVHQIELELQNEELVLAKEHADAAVMKYIELYDFAPAGYFTLSVNGEIIQLNLLGSQMIGIERSNLQNKMFTSYVSDNTKQIFNNFFIKVFQSRIKEMCEVILLTDDNRELNVHLSGIVTTNGKHCLITALDITDREEAETAMRKSEEQYRLLHINASIAIGFFNTDGTIISYNRSAANLMKNIPEFFIGKSIYDIYPQQEAELYHERIKMAALSEDPVFYEHMESLLSGDRYFLSTFTRIVDLNNNIYGVQVISQDITDRKLAEDKVQKLLEDKELILKEVHHRIKNNMNTIKSLLTLQAGTLEDSSAIAALEDAGNRVYSMMLLYDRLYQSEDYKVISTTSYISSLVDQVVANFPNSASVRIEKKIDDIGLDEKKIQPIGIIINELFTNMMKHAFIGKAGGVIKLSATMNGNHVKLILEDNGIGIPEHICFESSTGFGMQLVSMLTKQIGGRIRIERGDGTRFVLEFEV